MGEEEEGSLRVWGGMCEERKRQSRAGLRTR